MTDDIVDTDVLIDYVRGQPVAIALVSGLEAVGTPTTHINVAAEFVSGARNLRELRILEGVLARFEIHGFVEADGKVAMDFLKTKRLSHNVGWSDCMIAAAAKRLGVGVITANEKHFLALEGVKVSHVYRRDA